MTSRTLATVPTLVPIGADSVDLIASLAGKLETRSDPLSTGLPRDAQR